MQFKGKLSKSASKKKLLGKCISFVVCPACFLTQACRMLSLIFRNILVLFYPNHFHMTAIHGDAELSASKALDDGLTVAGSAFLCYDGPSVAAFILGSKSTRRYSELAEAYERSSNSDVLKWAVSSSQALTALYSENAMNILYCWKDSTAVGCFWFKKITGLAKSVVDPTLWNRLMFNIVFSEWPAWGY